MFRRRRSPQESRLRLEAAEEELLRFEAESAQWAAEAREAAKASLRLGDDRGYKRAVLRYATATRETEIAAGLVEMVQALLEAVRAQAGLERLVSIAEGFEEPLRESGLDADRLRRIKDHVGSGLDTVNRAAVSITGTLKSVSWGETAQQDLDAVHEELLAEIERETTARMRMKQELHDKTRTEDPR